MNQEPVARSRWVRPAVVIATGAGVAVGGACIALSSIPHTEASKSSEGLPDFVALGDVDPTIVQEIRYHGDHNFVGRPIDGYSEPLCILTRQAAEALHSVQEAVRPRGYTLKVYDCYRPQRSVDDFIAWGKDNADQKMRAEFYPAFDTKEELFQGYIATRSGHSRGSTVDLTLVPLPVPPQRAYVDGEPLVACTAPVDERFPDNTIDMGTGFDCLDTLSNTDDPRISETQRANRDLLRTVMTQAGFTNYDKEWWHFTLDNEPFPDTYFDFPLSIGALSPRS